MRDIYLRRRCSAFATLRRGIVNLPVGAHALVTAGRVDAVQVGIARRVQTLVDVHALASMAQLPETLGTPAIVVV